MNTECHQQPTPRCPACFHSMTTDDMLSRHDDDLFAVAPNEHQVEIECPSCGVTFHCQGGYVPHYTTALDEDDL